MADDDARQADLARERLGREEALPGEPPWGGTGVADLRQAEHPQGGAGAIRGFDELVEAVHEGADGNEDHKSRPRAQHGPGERPQLLRPLDEEEVGNRVDQPSGQAGLEAAAGLDEDDSRPHELAQDENRNGDVRSCGDDEARPLPDKDEQCLSRVDERAPDGPPRMEDVVDAARSLGRPSTRVGDVKAVLEDDPLGRPLQLRKVTASRVGKAGAPTLDPPRRAHGLTTSVRWARPSRMRLRLSTRTSSGSLWRNLLSEPSEL